MGRKPRVEYAGALYHVMCRGNCREEIFHYGYDLSGNRTDYGITGRQVGWEYDPHNRIAQITDTQGYTGTINVSSGQNLQSAIDTAAEGSLILVGDGTYDPITLTNAITVQSQNGPASTRIAGGSPARPATLTSNARLIGFTLTGGSLSGTNNGAGAFVDKGCLISDCIVTSNQTALCSNVATPGGKGGGLYLRGTALRCTIENNTAWNGAGAFLEDGASMAGCTVSSNTASGVNSYGGGLYLQDGATAINCAMANNAATDGGGLFFDNGGLAQGINSSSNTVDSIGGAGAFLWAGGTLRNGIIQANTATNTYARGGAGILFYDEGGLVEDSTIAGNLSVTNGGIHYRYSGIVDPGSLGTVNNSILWNNGTQSTVWSGTGNQTIDPSTTNSATGADIPASPYASAGIRTTSYKYDLNGNPLRRTYPTGVVETRGFDALNRLQSFDVSAGGSSLFDIQYSYDAVGSAREMVQTSIGLEGQSLDATYAWEYDNRYRLTAETCTAGGSPASRTEFGLDPADNRLEKREYTAGALQETTVYTPNNMNQMTGWTNSAKVVSYGFDANGNRTNKTMMATGATNSVSTAYSYDEDNRLFAVALNDAPTNTHTFAYDYRSRRYHRSTPNGETLHIFDGGLCVQEYDATQSATPNAQSLDVEFIRGEGMGGGVGGMVYSIRSGGIRCSHANHRGDIVARTGSSGELTWIALYKAYGKRMQELGSNADRQKANTKDEETDLDMLFEGMRIRCLESDVWFTLDPIGFADGPNRYAYVHANPITQFDPFGLFKDDAGRDLFNQGIAEIEKTDFFDTELGGHVKDSLDSRYHEENDVKGKDGKYHDTIRFGKTQNGRAGEYDSKTGTITLNKKYFNSLSSSANKSGTGSAMNSTTSLKDGDFSMTTFAGTIGHEGMHAYQDDSGIKNSTLNKEKEAYTVGAYIEDSLRGGGRTQSQIFSGMPGYNTGVPYNNSSNMSDFRLHYANKWAAQEKANIQVGIDNLDRKITGKNSLLKGSDNWKKANDDKVTETYKRDNAYTKWFGK